MQSSMHNACQHEANLEDESGMQLQIIPPFAKGSGIIKVI
ncbi:hypothetical protein DB41_EY00170 [Neochlamydia sp. TUME1]|nr:hypothetical protein DB41_EY00170 [Neochlamydia sp. TUME1]